MATPLTDGINALTAYANEVTGASDTTLSDAVESLVAGYGQGGGSTLWKTVTLTEDSSNDANPVTWFSDLGIDVQTDLENYWYICNFSNNTAANNYRCMYLMYTVYDNTMICCSIRTSNFSSISGITTTSRVLRATQGTVINIYKAPRT